MVLVETNKVAGEKSKAEKKQGETNNNKYGEMIEKRSVRRGSNHSVRLEQLRCRIIIYHTNDPVLEQEIDANIEWLDRNGNAISKCESEVSP